MDFVHYFSPFDRVGGKGRIHPKLLFRVGNTASLSILPTSRLSRGEGCPPSGLCPRTSPQYTRTGDLTCLSEVGPLRGRGLTGSSPACAALE
eukprot:scaffold16232_cov126-Isochrysis_galbana.AAC.2